MGNYFRPRATLCLNLCLAGHIQVKKAKSKLKNLPLRAGYGPRAVCFPPPFLMDRGSIAMLLTRLNSSRLEIPCDEVQNLKCKEEPFYFVP